MKKGFRHYIGIPFTPLSSEAKSTVPAPSPPENVQIEGINEGNDGLITWDPPSGSASPCNLTEVWIDGAFVANTSGNSYVFATAYNVTYTVKLRCVSLFNTKSAFTPDASYTGAGLPTMQVSSIGMWRQIGVFWAEVESNANYTIEGYNVYDETAGAPGTKLNGALIPVNEIEWFVYGLDPGESKTIAISFEYNGGTESVTYPTTNNADGAPGEIWAAIIDNQRAYLVSKVGTPVSQAWGPDAWGLRVTYLAEVTITTRSYKKPPGRQWTYPEYDTLIESRSLTGTNDWKFRYHIGYSPCTPTELLATGEPLINYPVASSIRYHRRRTSGSSFVVSGPKCSGSADDPQHVYLISCSGNDFRGVEHPPDDYGLEFVDMSVPDPNITINVDGTTAECSWDPVNDADGYNLFYRAAGSTDPFIQPNTNPITGEYYEVTGLAPGSYEIGVGFVSGDYYETPPNSIREFGNFTIV